jgi:hypothetical protein
MKAMVSVLPFATGVASAPEDALEAAKEPASSRLTKGAGLENASLRFFDDAIVS